MAPAWAIECMVAGIVLQRRMARPRWGDCVSFATRAGPFRIHHGEGQHEIQLPGEGQKSNQPSNTEPLEGNEPQATAGTDTQDSERRPQIGGCTSPCCWQTRPGPTLKRRRVEGWSTRGANCAENRLAKRRPFATQGRPSRCAQRLAELSQLRAIFGIFAIIFAAKPCVSIAAL